MEKSVFLTKWFWPLSISFFSGCVCSWCILWAPQSVQFECAGSRRKQALCSSWAVPYTQNTLQNTDKKVRDFFFCWHILSRLSFIILQQITPWLWLSYRNPLGDLITELWMWLDSFSSLFFREFSTQAILQALRDETMKDPRDRIELAQSHTFYRPSLLGQPWGICLIAKPWHSHRVMIENRYWRVLVFSCM